MTKISPIAAYLTENHAIAKRQGNVWHFFSKEGMYIGRQVKTESNGANAYIREIYGAEFKRLFSECKVIGQRCTYFKDMNSPLGIGIVPTYTYIMTNIADFITNKVRSIQVEKRLKNKMDIIAIEPNVGVGIYDISKPFIYSEDVLRDETNDMRKSIRVKHTYH